MGSSGDLVATAGVDEAPSAVPRTSHLFNAVSAALAFALWGGWAYWINADHGAAKQIVSALAQGTASFVITLVMVRIVARLYQVLPAPLKLPGPALITVGCTGSALVAIHAAVGTPEILKTVAAPLSVALGFCAYTTVKLQRMSSSNGVAA